MEAVKEKKTIFGRTSLLGLWTILTFLLVLFSSYVETFPSSSKTIFKRVTEGVQITRCSQCQADGSPLRNRHRCLYADGRLYLLSLKGKRQPSFGSYHETALYGGYLSAYGVAENETDPRINTNRASGSPPWSWSHSHFDAIDKNENREDAFFIVKNTLFLLTYSRFENVTYRTLYTWQRRRPSSGWIKVPLDVDERSEFLDGNIQNGALAWTGEDNENEISDEDEEKGIVYFAATDGWGRVKISKLEIIFDERSNDRSPSSAIMRYLTGDQSSPVNSAGAIVTLAHRAGRLYAFYGSQGCGFHWEKSSVIIVHLNSSSIEHVNLTLESNSPPWAFNGPAFVEQDGSNLLMFGGSIAAGVAKTEFDPRIWIFNLDTLRWRKLNRARIPDHLNPYDTCSAIDPDGRMVFLADFRNIYKASLEQLYE